MLVLCGSVVPAYAQDTGQVLMRRPLPGSKTTSTPTSNPGSTPTTTPSGTPSSGTPSGTPGATPDEPGLTSDPANVDPGQDPGPGVYVYQWVVSPWQGDAQCGQASTLTRSVSCQATDTQGGGGGGGPISLSSYDPSTSGAQMAPAVFDPASSDVKMALAQFGDPGGGKTYTVPPQYCLDNVGPQPETNYAGTGAGCGYTPNVDYNSPSEWTLPPGASGTLTCSRDAYREFPYTCTRDSDGATVSKTYCQQNIGSDMSPSDQLPPREVGSFAGCTATWSARLQDLGCHGQDDPFGQPGAVHYVDQQSSCIRSDGTYLYGTDAAACGPNSDATPDGIMVFGSCHSEVNSNAGRGRCLVDGNGLIKHVVLRSGHFSGVNIDVDKEAKSCFDAGATCVATRSPASNYQGNGIAVNDAGDELVCTDGKAELQGSGSAYYSDECKYAASPELGCPIFYNNSLFGLYWTPDTQVPTYDYNGGPGPDSGPGGGGTPIG